MCLTYVFFSQILIATRIRSLANILHECCHYSYFKIPKANKFLGLFLSFFLLIDYKKYTKSHWAHHLHFGKQDLDGDYDNYQKTRVAIHCKNCFWTGVKTVFNLRNIYIYNKNNFDIFNCSFVSNISMGIYILGIVFFVFLFPSFMIYFFIIPFLTFYQMLKIFSDYYDHHKNYEHNLPFRENKSFSFFKKIIAPVFFPRNDLYHALHHQFPWVPSRCLSKIRNHPL